MMDVVPGEVYWPVQITMRPTRVRRVPLPRLIFPKETHIREELMEYLRHLSQGSDTPQDALDLSRVAEPVAAGSPRLACWRRLTF